MELNQKLRKEFPFEYYDYSTYIAPRDEQELKSFAQAMNKMFLDENFRNSINIRVVKATLKDSEKFPKLMDFDSNRTVKMIKLIARLIPNSF